MAELIKLAKRLRLAADKLEEDAELDSELDNEEEIVGNGPEDFKTIKVEVPEKLLKQYKLILTRLRINPGLGKIKALIDNITERKSAMILSKMMDEAENKVEIDINDFVSDLRVIFRRYKNFPATKLLKQILDFGIKNEWQTLANILRKKNGIWQNCG